MKFGDIITAVASLAVIYIVLDFVFFAAVISVNTYWGPDISTIVSALVASLIVGYMFAAKIHEESRTRAISKIIVLSTLVLTFYTMALFANPYMNTAVQDGLESMFSTSGWTTWDWVAYAQLMMSMLVTMNLIFNLVFGFVGLYAGSMLKRGAKK